MMVQKMEYWFDNLNSRKKGEKLVQMGVIADNILAAKRKMIEKGYENLDFLRIEYVYEKI